MARKNELESISPDMSKDINTETAGDDMLYGSSADDILDGGAGNDGLYGYEGNNTFVFGPGYGKDYISSSSTTASLDKIIYKGVISDLVFSSDGDFLFIKIVDTPDELKIYDWTAFRADQFQENMIECADGYISKSYITNIINDIPAFNNGYPAGSLTLAPVAFAYCDIANIGNKNSLTYSISVLSSMPYVVIAQPGELNSSQTKVANEISRRGTNIFAYVNVGNGFSGMAALKDKIDNVANSGWYGVFIDQFGKNSGETREMHNEIIDYIHGKNLKCFVNAWFLTEAFESDYDANFNPNCIESHLGAGDWWLDESFLVSSDRYFANIEFFEKHVRAIEYKRSLGINLVGLSYKRAKKTWAESVSDIEMSYILALSLGYDGWWMQESIEQNADPVIDKYNHDIFEYARDFSIDIGLSLVQPLKKISSGQFVAITDKYRVVFTPTNYIADGTDQNATMDLQQLGVIDDSNIALGKKTVASSVEVTDGRFVPKYAVDGLSGSRWSSSNSGADWIKVDLGEVSSIHKIILEWDVAMAATYDICVSNDDASYSVFSPSAENITPDPNSTNSIIPGFVARRDVLAFSDLSCRYIIIDCKAPATACQIYSLWNLEVYGTN